MVTQYDDKGKIFTQVISKKPMRVLIQTDRHQIEGIIHIRPTERLIDELNHSQTFIAITDAIIRSLTSEEVVSSEFLSVNVDHVAWVLPVDALQAKESKEAE